jgi:hypothetical protein
MPHARQADESNSAALCVRGGVVWITATRLRWKDRGKSSQMPTQKLTNEIIAAAVEGYEAQKIRIDGKIAELRAMLPGGSPEAAPEAPTRKRKVSAAARRRMAIAQKKRWAATKGKAEPPAAKEAPKPKRRISKEGLARIVAATKKRWAAVRAAKAQQEKAAAKKSATKKAKKAKKAAVTAPAVAQAAG